jgi:hypothetical protein
VARRKAKFIPARRTRKSARPDRADIGVAATWHHAYVAMRQAKMDRASDVSRTLFFGPHTDTPAMPLPQYGPVPAWAKGYVTMGNRESGRATLPAHRPSLR